MSVIVTDSGFGPDDFTGEILDLASDTAPEALEAGTNADLVRIDFPSSADGRGFTLARLLRPARRFRRGGNFRRSGRPPTAGPVDVPRRLAGP